MKFKIVPFLFFILVFSSAQSVLCQNSSTTLSSQEENSNLSLSEIIKKVENRYAASSFSTNFFQALNMKEMGITDTASGKAFFKYPGMMRWEYEKPDKQIIITNSNRLWIYWPDDNKVMIGESHSFFGDGKGASFLADMKLISQKFSITLEKYDIEGYHVLKLVPKEKTLDLSAIYLFISTKTFVVNKITMYKIYGDEKNIELINIQYKQKFYDYKLFI